MYHIKINKERLKNHIQYDWWKYIVAILATVLLWNLATTVLKPRIPDNKKIHIFFVGEFVDEEKSEYLSNSILEDFPELLKVDIDFIPLGGPGGLEYAGQQKLMVMLGSQTGDMFIMDKEDFNQIAQQGAFFPLDSFVNENKGLLDIKDLESYRLSVQDGDGEAHYYGIPMDYLVLPFITEYNTSDKAMGITAYSKNLSTALDVLEWMMKDTAIK
ncbi:MAG: extracellular solute-binding protein [Clostridiales bacterium]|nr:extracellular solute-binding protein [Clostridiales bacterium]